MNTLKARLERLEQLGDPLRITEVHDPNGTFALELADSAGKTVETELDGKADVPWMDAWQIIGCLVEHTQHEPDERDRLLYAAKLGLDEVLDVRIAQLEASR